MWADELAAWRYPESWAQAKFGLRLGVKPRACVTTTPKPTQLIRELMADKATHVTRGKTYDNRENLAESFFAEIIKTYEGTRLGRQELNAEVLDDNPHGLWTRARIDELRR
jgi:phage terminase large subunit-like protein